MCNDVYSGMKHKNNHLKYYNTNNNINNTQIKDMNVIYCVIIQSIDIAWLMKDHTKSQQTHTHTQHVSFKTAHHAKEKCIGEEKERGRGFDHLLYICRLSTVVVIIWALMQLIFGLDVSLFIVNE